MAPTQMSLEGKGHRRKKFNPEWVVLAEVLARTRPAALRESGWPYHSPEDRLRDH